MKITIPPPEPEVVSEARADLPENVIDVKNLPKTVSSFEEQRTYLTLVLELKQLLVVDHYISVKV